MNEEKCFNCIHYQHVGLECNINIIGTGECIDFKSAQEGK